jgi:hypothetical protein
VSEKPCAEYCSSLVGVEADRHEFPVGRNVEKLFAIVAPSRLRAAGVGDGDMWARTGKRLNYDAAASGHTALANIGNPFSIWENFASPPARRA